ncbi:hypothetical protein [Levilactobacillus acidifarinae]|uniref:HTH iclR-type domain-containing protein n=1 Tax=Levilactobacillus acidifarinae DSM 19394 = JCM 15949 TaxID=1423715 RepID=A0A0R1LG54_9LACO|nr:hypothetical protein [Levilactobacillus acidifarinae]KRK94701.1 hypothetical protein FD25_GL000673 [Levilactobacillus acidifarinae DSM 19394]GEO68455.1 hypothetical protein LAC03_03650 [Levilactobacillus acidifarinae]
MLGYVLGRDGDIHDFIETLKRVHGELDYDEIQLVRELIELATHPGYTINMAKKLNLTSVELSDYLQHLRVCGLIDYWSDSEKTSKTLSLLSE